MKIIKFLLILSLYITGMYLVWGVAYSNGYEAAAIEEELCELRFDNPETYLINGLYSSDGYFCVLTDGRSPDMIAETTFHELAHYYNDVYGDHFFDDRITQH